MPDRIGDGKFKSCIALFGTVTGVAKKLDHSAPLLHLLKDGVWLEKDVRIDQLLTQSA
jgi:hypothetical protein